MQNDPLRDFLKFFRFHLAWFILSAGFFAVILISGVFLSTKYVVDTTTEQAAVQVPSASPEELSLAVPPEAPSVPVPPTEPLVVPPQAQPVSSAPVATAVPTPQPTPSSTPSATSVPVIDSSYDQVTGLPPRSYVVKTGDTLWNIAQSTYGDGHLYSKIAAANSLKNANLIQVGQTLSLPALSDQDNAVPGQKGSITDKAWSDDKTVYQDYTIVPGDSLWKIAEQQLGDPYRWMEIYQANQVVVGSNPDLIYPDTVLRIPTDSQPVSSSPQSSTWTSSLLQ